MNFATVPKYATLAPRRAAPRAGLCEIRAGDDAVLAADSQTVLDEALRGCTNHGLDAARRADAETSVQLLVVVQKGRLFQHAHPEVRVLLDHGRYLVVSAASEIAGSLKSHPPCYSVRRVTESIDLYQSRAAPPPGLRRERRAAIATLVDRLDMDAYRSDVQQLVEIITRHSLTAGFQASIDLCRSALEPFDYEVSEQPFSMPGGSSRNLVAVKSGQGGADRPIVLAVAHLDSINHEGSAASRAPGADDNASGSAGVLAIGRALAAQAATADLRLILFGGEEQGLHGSLQFVASLTDDERGRIAGVLNMDMIANVNATPAAALLEGSPLSQTLLDGLADAAETYTTLAVQTSLHPFNSDHVPFLDAGIPAVLTIEGTDGANDRVHTDRDTVDQLEFDLAEQILRMNVAHVASLCE